MTQQEKEEIKDLPPKYRPLGAGEMLFYFFLMLIPIVGIVVMICFAFSNKNIARREFAMNMFMVLLTILIVVFIVYIISLFLW